MGMESAFDELLELAARLGVQVRHAHLGGSGGGLATVRGQRVLFVDQDADPEDQLEVVAKAMSRLDLENVFLRPDVRELIEQYRGS